MQRLPEERMAHIAVRDIMDLALHLGIGRMKTAVNGRAQRIDGDVRAGRLMGQHFVDNKSLGETGIHF